MIETEKVGFEPTVPFSITGFQDQLLKPLGHLSMKFSCFFLRSDLDYYILPTNGCQAFFRFLSFFLFSNLSVMFPCRSR